MPHRRRSVPVMVSVLLVLATLLAGCTSDKDDSGPPDPNAQGAGTGTGGGNRPQGPTDPGDAATRVAGARPIWFPGLEYRYDVSYPVSDISGELRIGIVQDTGSHWAVSVNATDDVLLQAFAWHLPALGPINKGDYAHPIHDVEVRLFDFPLEDGKTWTTKDHHDEDVNFTVSATDTPLYDGRTVKAVQVVGERGGVPWLTYVYTAEIGYFVSAQVDGDGDGAPDASMTLNDALVVGSFASAQRFTSSSLLAVFESGAVPAVDPAAPALPPAPGTPDTTSPTFTVEEQHTQLIVVIYLGGGPGFYSAQVDFPSGDSRQYNLTHTEVEPGFVVTGYVGPVTAGTGEVTTIPAGDGFVGIEVFGITRTTS